MPKLLRLSRHFRGLWRTWIPLLFVAALLPLSGLAMPLVEKQLIDGVILAHRLDLLLPVIALYGGLWLISTVCILFGSILRAYLDERIALGLRRALFSHSQALSVAFAKREHSARTLSLFVNDVPSLAGFYSTLTVGIVGSVISVVVGVVVMFNLSQPLAIAAGVVPALVVGAAWVATRPLRPAVRRAQEKFAELTEHLQENLAGLREVVAFGREQSQGARFNATLRDLLRLRMRVTLLDSAISTGQLLLSLTVTLVVIGYGGYLVIQGRTTIGTIIAMRSLFTLVFQPAGQLVSLASSVQKALGSADRLAAAMAEQPAVVERPGAVMPRHVAGEITFDHVSFAYLPGQSVLRDVSLQARPGEVVALVGPSGAGKSTLASLIARFYDPDAGRVLLDGTDLRDLPLADLRGHMALVFQDTFLFATTIRENIAFSSDTADETAIRAAAHAANAWEFIERLPHGLDTQVGERGVQLSEGQKQRIAIARALLRNPCILILDEPTSALDARSEHLLQSALDNLMRGRTTFVIAHRLATVQQADRILVVEGGRIVEQGTHADLLQRDGLYRELYALQFATAVEPARFLAPATPPQMSPLRLAPIIAPE